VLSSQKQLPDKCIGRGQRLLFFPELLILFRFTKKLLMIVRKRFVGHFIHDEPLSCVFVLLSRSRAVIVFIPNGTVTEYYLAADSTTHIEGCLHRSLSALCGSIVTLVLTRLCIEMKTPECLLCKNVNRFTMNRLAAERTDSCFGKHSVTETNETLLLRQQYPNGTRTDDDHHHPQQSDFPSIPLTIT